MLIQDIIKSPSKLSIYFLSILIFLVILIFSNYWFFPEILVKYGILYNGSAWQSFINNIIALVGSSLVYSGFIWFITPSGIKSSDVNVISSHDIKLILNDMLIDTETYRYLGHTARWTRSVTLPKLLEAANNERLTKQVELIILDPDNEEVCHYYSSFGHGDRKFGNKIESINDIRVELLTTFLYCLQCNRSSFINIKIYVSSRVSFFRYDIVDTALLMTKPYVGDPALHFPRGTFFYDSYKEEFNIVKGQCREINLQIANDQICDSSMKNILSDAGFDISYVDINFIEKLLNSYKNIKKPY